MAGDPLVVLVAGAPLVALVPGARAKTKAHALWSDGHELLMKRVEELLQAPSMAHRFVADLEKLKDFAH